MDENVKRILKAALTEIVEPFIKKNLDEWVSNTLTVSCIKEEFARLHRKTNLDLTEHRTTRQQQTSEIKLLTETTVEHSNDIQGLLSSLAALRDDVNCRAHSARVEALKKELGTLCPMSYVEGLSSTLKNTASTERIEELVKTMSGMECAMYELFFNKEDAESEFKRMERDFQCLFAGYAPKAELQATSCKLFRKSAELDNVLDAFKLKQKQALGQLREAVASLKSATAKKAEKSELRSLQQVTDSKASEDAIQRATEALASRISGLQNELTSLARQSLETEQTLLKLDGLLHDKASKAEHKELLCTTHALSKYIGVEAKIDEVLRDSQKLLLAQDEREGELRTLRSQVVEMRGFYSQKNNDSTELKRLRELMLEMQSSVSNKADRSETLNYLEQKAGWSDIHYIAKSLESMHKHMKLVVVNIGAMQRVVADPNRARGPERNQREYLAKVTQKLIDFIMKENPLHEAHALPEDLTELLQYSELLKTEKAPTRPLSSSPNKRFGVII